MHTLSILAESALNAAAEGITVADLNSVNQPLIYVNQGFVEMTGYSADDIIGKNCRILQGYETDKAVVRKIRTAISRGEACRVELLNFRKDGSAFWNRLTLAPIFSNPNMPATHYVGVQCNITESKLMQKNLQRYAEKLQEIQKEIEAGLSRFTNEIHSSAHKAVLESERIVRDIKLMNNEDISNATVQIHHANRRTNELISGLQVLLKNCGGVKSLKNIDPVSMEVRTVELSN